MKTLKRISIYLIISLAVIVSAGKDCVLFYHSPYVIENTTSESKSAVSLSSDLDLSEVDVSLNQVVYTFSLKHLPGERISVSDFFFNQNLYFHIWQPPKIS